VRIRDFKPLSSCFLLVLFLLCAPSLAGALTVSVPGTDIVGELQVDAYEISEIDWADSYMRGCQIEVSFLRTAGSDSMEDKNLRWLQLVSTNDPSYTNDPTQVVHLIDGVFDQLYHDLYDEPFYWARGDLIWNRSDSQFFFGDMPATNGWVLGWDIDTRFELYLVRQIGKTIQVLARITWGYRVDTSGVVRLYGAPLQKQNVASQAARQTLAEDFPGWSFTAGATSGDGDMEPSGDDGGDGGGCFIGIAADRLGW
jgi:hypothetical protein